MTIQISALTNIVNFVPNLIRKRRSAKSVAATSTATVQQPATVVVRPPTQLTLTVELPAGESQAGEAQPANDTAILHLVGVVNHQTYLDLLDRVFALYHGGTRNLTLDLAACERIDLSGLFVFHSIIALYRGTTPADPEAGWRGLHQMAAANHTAGLCKHVEFINAQPSVAETLAKNGLTR